MASPSNSSGGSAGSASSGGLSGYKVLESIGEGTFGKVSKVTRLVDGELLVWKELFYGDMSEREKQQLVAEVNILRELHHPHIVRYFDRVIDRDSKRIYIVMEYCPGGDLAALIRAHKRSGECVAEDFVWRVLAQLSAALHECHRKTSGNGKIVHRDLKPGNIFLDAKHNVKLGDFGLARFLKGTLDYAKTHVGTPYYMSPEQVKELKYNEQSDIWSLGCLIYELACLRPPFRAANHLALAVKIQQGKYKSLPSQYSSELDRAIRNMLQVKPSRRPTVEQLLRLPRVVRYNREQKMQRQYSSLKRREEELRLRELALVERELRLNEREARLVEREQRLAMHTKARGRGLGKRVGRRTGDKENFGTAGSI